jgi:competence ComEA-like helix-hairpin-helix protein
MAGFRDKVWIIISVFLAVSLITGIVFLAMRLRQLQPIEIVLHDAKEAGAGTDICITGAVARPGIYAMRPDDTLNSLISAAGLSDNSDLSAIKIYVPGKGETTQPQKIDLNRAGVWLLSGLPGIGEGKAKQIFDFRNKNGPFRSIDDLFKIEGFGKSTVDKIRDFATIGD